MTDEYNYARFDEYVATGREREEFGAFPNHLHTGEQAPDFSAQPLDEGKTVTLMELARRRGVVLEFGSFT
jgi:hypothetical protein